MANIQQDAPQITFRVPEWFKRRVFSEVALRGTTIQDFGIRVFAQGLDIPVPDEETGAEPSASAKKRRAG